MTEHGHNTQIPVSAGGGGVLSNAVNSHGSNGQLRILHLEDNPMDAELIRASLENDGFVCEIVLVQDKAQFESILEQQHFDLILSDFALPDYDGLTALRLVRTKLPGTPFILVSGTLGEENAVDSLKNGATDYILKSRLLRLPAAVRRALGEAEFYAQYHQAEQKLQHSQELFRQITENVEDLVAVLDLEGRRVFNSPSYRRLLGDGRQWEGGNSFEEIHPDDVQRVKQIFRETIVCGVGQRTEYRFLLKDGSVRHIESQGSVIRDGDGNPSNVLVVSRDITERKHAEAALARTQKELLEASRQAGMAEVATGVLHNVGNVLNSVNVASNCLADGLRKSKTANLARVATLLCQHESDLGEFLANDPKGRQIPDYLKELGDHLVSEQAAALNELAHLQKNIEHIKEIISMQQSFAKVSGLTENLKLTDVLEDALKMNEASLSQHAIGIVKEFDTVPPVAVQKHKVLQILINLIRNAQHACDDSGRDDKQMTLRIKGAHDRVQISVSDNGVGIPSENLTRIFSHGFTTKNTGHGFGLHSGALAAKEMGGTLTVRSDGVGCGATFTLELPAITPNASA